MIVIHQEALNRIGSDGKPLYDIDRISNGKLLAETAKDYVILSEAYPTHFGSHPKYDDAIRTQIDDLIDVNDVDVFDLGNLSDVELMNLVNALENRATPAAARLYRVVYKNKRIV